ncbi:hypothetical protein Syun_016872 [Stephania yunnanensis]|uniref:Uncharacterized protein n=1 Tax=Stephania yunnanensis TaxID=152371 RepID=A0AAP0J6U1_9MAGN
MNKEDDGMDGEWVPCGRPPLLRLLKKRELPCLLTERAWVSYFLPPPHWCSPENGVFLGETKPGWALIWLPIMASDLLSPQGSKAIFLQKDGLMEATLTPMRSPKPLKTATLLLGLTASLLVTAGNFL